MLTPELKKEIDEKWDACWPLSLLKPVTIPDLISYLFFLKKISESHPVSEKSINSLDNGFFHPTETEEMHSGIINEMEPQNMQTLFTSEKGSIDLVKKYSRSLAFGAYVKGGLLVTPTQKLLANAVAIMKMIEDETIEKKGEIFDYLLNKKELNGPNGQAYLPRYLVNLMIAIIQPGDKDVILDPSVGDGSLLVASAKYIADNNPESNDPDPRKFVGLESDLTSLRIAGMNMILHGINNPELKAADSFSSLGSLTIEQPTVIVSNLIFSVGESRMVVEGASIKEATRKEILYLKFIIKNAAPGSRIAVIVPDMILYNNATEFLAIRQEVMDRFKVEAVISLNDKTIPKFFGTSILIFYKKTPALAGKVWFYKIEHCNETANNENLPSDNEPQNDTIDLSGQRGELAEILNHFNNRDHSEESQNPDSFYIDAGVIRSKSYGLSYNEYSLFKDQEKAIHLSETTSDEKKVAIKNLRNPTNFPVAEKLPDAKKSRIKKVMIISFLSVLVLGIGLGAYWFLDHNKSNLMERKQDDATVSDIKTVTPVTTSDTISSIASTTPVKPAIQITSVKTISKVEAPATKASTKYAVMADRAYFYRSPDTTTRREIYINNLVHAVLTPEKERNGFVYVIYTNKLGESTIGWLDKNDLKSMP